MRQVDVVGEPARRTPNAVAMACGDRSLTFAQLDERVGRLGGALRARGLVPGDRVALLAANELEYVEIQAACVRSGFTLVPLNRRLADPELDFMLRDADARVLVAGRHDEAAARRVAVDGCLLIGLGRPQELEQYDALLESGEYDPGADPDDPALATTILYTSGTTGRPKGAVIDRFGFTARVLVNLIELAPRSDDRWLQILPMFHIAAFLGYAFLYAGAEVVMLETFDPAGCLQIMRERGVSATVVVPTVLKMLLDRVDEDGGELPRLRLVVYGGSTIEPALLRRALARLGCGFHQQYGMTETGAQTILRPADHDPSDLERLASAGTEAVTFSVRIVGSDEEVLPDGEVGEIVCRGPAVTSSYWNRPEASGEAWRGGWFHTGDLGFRDGNGYLHVVDRRNDLIVSGGENVYPSEVEAALLEHPGVLEVAVVGTPDAAWGQVVTAVLAGAAAPDSELEDWLAARIARYKIPRRWIHLEELPRNATGKVLKGELRARWAEEEVR
ncbi:MAG TPA: AMP-binding protein [Acidimicrobiales bacterium]|nr:AMP-binding protein [Acidimicrobiales bacterium]